MKINGGNNKGFSLIELVVAVLILAILSGGAIAAFGTVRNARSESAAKVLASVLKQTRQKAMGLDNKTHATTSTEEADKKYLKTDVYTEIYFKDGNYYADLVYQSGGTTTVLISEKLGNDALTITFKDSSDSTNKTTVGDGSGPASPKVVIYFKKNTGGISRIDTYPEMNNTAKLKLNKLDEILVEGSGEDRNIIMVHPTGRCFYEN